MSYKRTNKHTVSTQIDVHTQRMHKLEKQFDVPIKEGHLYRAQMPKGMRRDPDSCLAELRAKKNGRVVLLCRDAECERATGKKLSTFYTENGFKVTHFPVKDFGAWEQKEYNAKVYEIFRQLVQGENIVVHCMGGIGRTGTIIAGVAAAMLNLSDSEAITFTREHSHRRAVETQAQKNLIKGLTGR